MATIEKNIIILGSSRKRIDFIDVMRGLLIIWMILSHALGRAQVPNDHILQLLRPHGWATYGFVMVSGFSIGYLFKWSGGVANALQRKLWKRAFQIGVAAYLSNLIFISVTLLLDNALSLEIFFKIASFQYPWGYSAILIPTTLLLIIAPWLLKISYNNSSSVLLVMSSAIVITIGVLVNYCSDCYSHNLIFQVLFTRNSYVIFPIGYLFLYAIWAFTFASWIKKYQQQRDVLLMIVAISSIICFCAYYFFPYNSYNPNVFIVISRFPIIVLISVTICAFSVTQLLRNGLGLIGRSALLVYIIHRPLLGVIDLLFNNKFSGVELACILMLFGVIVSFLICFIKEKNLRLFSSLSKIGL